MTRASSPTRSDRPRTGRRAATPAGAGAIGPARAPAAGAGLLLLPLLWRCFLEARPAVQGIFLLRFAAGASFGGPLLAEGPDDFSLWAGAALCVCATLSVYVLNGVMDVEEDRVNGSSRPIARGKLTVAQATGAAVVLGASSLAGGFALGSALGWSILAALGLGWLYSGPPFYLKRWPAGLALVAFLAGLLIYQAGHAANGGGGDARSSTVFAVVMALWMALVGQTKDLSDVEGDRLAGRRSAPVAWGEGPARLAASAAAVALGASFVASARSFAPDLLAPALVRSAGALAVATIALGPWSRGARSARRRPYKAFMLAQYGVHLAVIVW